MLKKILNAIILIELVGGIAMFLSGLGILLKVALESWPAGTGFLFAGAVLIAGAFYFDSLKSNLRSRR